MFSVVICLVYIVGGWFEFRVCLILVGFGGLCCDCGVVIYCLVICYELWCVC